jgi:nicotinate-nucleotide adenylyltransferase
MSIYFGGAFDPVHVGHLALAEFVQVELAEQVIFLPAGNSPFKNSHSATFEDRVHMLRLALRDSAFGLDTREGLREGPSWTCDTLEELSRERAERHKLLMGSDQLAKFRQWHRWERILELADLLVINRPGENQVDTVPHQALVWPGMELSSSWLRERLASGKPCRYLLPEGVHAYIKEQGLYEA